MAKRRRRKKSGLNGKGKALLFFLVVAVCAAAVTLYLQNRGGIALMSSGSMPSDSPGGSIQASSAVSASPSSSVLEIGGSYITAEHGEIYRGSLILVNAEHEYQFPDEEHEDMEDIYEKKTDHYQIGNSGLYLQNIAIDALNEMAGDFYEAKGKSDLLIASAYRSYDHQKRLFDRKVDELGEAEASMWVSRPGHSEHHTGFAVDFSVYEARTGSTHPYDGTGIYAWVNENSYRYGYIVRYDEAKADLTGISYEPWHFRYVGLPHAFLIQEKSYCFEEYHDYLKGFSFDDPLQCRTDGGEYEIYYVPAEEGTTRIPVPETGSYEVSGNNMDGFIVTVSK